MSPSRHLHFYNVVIRRTRRLKCMPLGRRVNVSPPLHYKNIGKHELEPSRDRDFSLSNPYNSAKIHDAHTLQRPREKFPSPSSRPDYREFIFSFLATPGFDRILHAGVEIIPRAPVSKGARNFRIRSSNPYTRASMAGQRKLADAENHRAAGRG